MKTYKVTVNGKTYEVEIEEVAAGTASTVVAAPAPAAKPVAAAPVKAAAPAPAPVAADGEPVKSPLQGTVLKVPVSAGQSVKKGDIIVVIEAMKMENEIRAPRDCTINSVAVSAGAGVASGDILLTLK